MIQTTHKIFIDSSFFLSFIDRANLNYKRASEIFEFLGKQNYHVYTSSPTIIQAFNRIEKDLGVTIAQDFLQAILESDIEVIFPERSEYTGALRFLKNYSAKNASLTEIINAILMEKRGIRPILTFDFWNNLMGTQISNLVIGQ